jgi:hypothetical protein
MTPEHQPVGPRGVRRPVTDPSGKTYLVQVARSGFVQWSRGGAQGPLEWVVHTVGTRLVNWLIFWGGWSVVVYRGDEIAPQREKLLTRRYRNKEQAIEAMKDLEIMISRVGPPQN